MDAHIICKNTPNPSFCLSLLNSKPGGVVGADLETLAQYTFAVLYSNVTNTIYLIKNQLVSIGHQDHLAKYHLNYCLGRFLSAKSDIEYAKSLLKTSKDYRSMSLALVDSSISGQNCLATPFGYKDTSMLPKYVENIQQVNQVIRIILNLLGSV